MFTEDDYPEGSLSEQNCKNESRSEQQKKNDLKEDSKQQRYTKRNSKKKREKKHTVSGRSTCSSGEQIANKLQTRETGTTFLCLEKALLSDPFGEFVRKILNYKLKIEVYI